MSTPFMPETAGETLEMIHAVEQAAMSYTDPKLKTKFYEEVLDPQYLDPVVDHYLSVSSQQVLTRNPAKGRSWTGQLTDRRFFAFVANCCYRRYEDLGINGLIFSFVEPSLFDVQPEHRKVIKRLQFIAPVLRVTAFHDADVLTLGSGNPRG